MGIWTVITLIGGALGIIGVFVSNWAENHPRHKEPRATTRAHDIALGVGLVGWVIAVIGIAINLLDHLR
jgi:hypothetical protein